jgi:hypothetical protein
MVWSAPQAAQLGQRGAVWSPVLHATPDGTVLLFYTESHACFRPTNPKTYMPGGRAITLTPLHFVAST